MGSFAGQYQRVKLVELRTALLRAIEPFCCLRVPSYLDENIVSFSLSPPPSFLSLFYRSRGSRLRIGNLKRRRKQMNEAMRMQGARQSIGTSTTLAGYESQKKGQSKENRR